jgi:hypothetical protein
MATDQTEAMNCAVCGKSAEAALSAECNWCDGRFHLNQRNDLEAKDCGKVWIDEQFLALQFACDNCLAEGGPLADGSESVDAPRRDAPASGQRRRYRRRA